MPGSKYQMNMEEMENRIGRTLGTFEKIQFIKNPITGKLSEWHFHLNVWTNITPE